MFIEYLDIRRSVFIGVLTLGACSITPPTAVRELAWIEFSAPTEVVDVSFPPRAEPGETFTFSFSTYHSGCARPDGTDVAVTGSRADLRPFTERRIDERGCVDTLVRERRRVDLAFSETGIAEVVLHGRSRISGDTVVRSISFEIVIGEVQAGTS